LRTNKNLVCYVAVSKTIRDELLKSGINPRMVRVIPNSVSFDIENIPDQRINLSAEFNIPTDSTLCVAVGRLHPVKGYDILIDACRYLIKEKPDFYFFIVGGGEMQAALQGIINKSGLKNRIKMLGFKERDVVLSIIKSCDIFLMPSYSEGTPIALMEAGLLGKAIIASEVGGIPDLVDNYEHAILIPPGDAQALARALMELRENPKLLERLGSNIQKKIRGDFNLESTILATCRVYQEAARNRGRDSDLRMNQKMNV
jgi:glycosyltransferase involved in cell wall biosynthesis